MEYKDYYKIMGVPRTASADEIKRAYRRLARKFHPDVSKERNAETKFKDLQEAHEVLKDPEKRAAYDQLGANWQAGQRFDPPPGAEGFAGGDFSDFFESIFGAAGMGGGGRRQTHQRRPHTSGPRHRGAGVDGVKGDDVSARLAISLEDAYQGGERQVTIEVPMVDSFGLKRPIPRTLNVKIPKGITAGKKIRLAGQGAPGLGSAGPGDLLLEIDFLPHPLYRVEGRDVVVELPIAPWEAALGASVAVPTLGGRVDLKLPAGTQGGRKLRLKERGLPGDPTGDCYVVVKIVTPPASTESLKRLYQKLQEESRFDARADFYRI